MLPARESKPLAVVALPTLAAAMLPALLDSKPLDASKLLAMPIAVPTAATTPVVVEARAPGFGRHLSVSRQPSASTPLQELVWV